MDYAQHLEDMMPQNMEEVPPLGEAVEPDDFSGASEDR